MLQIRLTLWAEKWPGMWVVLGAPQQHRVFESRGSGLIPAFPADAVLSAQATPSLVLSQRQNPPADGVGSTYGQHCAQGGSSW